MPAQSVEDRLAELEEKVARLTDQLAARDSNATAPWWEQISGVFKDDPLFEDAVRFGKEWRKSHCQPENVEDDGGHVHP